MYVRWTFRSDSTVADAQAQRLAVFGFQNNIELWMDATVALYLEALELSYDKLDVPGVPNGADDLVSRMFTSEIEGTNLNAGDFLAFNRHDRRLGKRWLLTRRATGKKNEHETGEDDFQHTIGLTIQTQRRPSATARGYTHDDSLAVFYID